MTTMCATPSEPAAQAARPSAFAVAFATFNDLDAEYNAAFDRDDAVACDKLAERHEAALVELLAAPAQSGNDLAQKLELYFRQLVADLNDEILHKSLVDALIADARRL